MRILIVDDEENIREACCKSLARIGHEVEVATRADEALAMIDVAAFDLALLDIRMPGMDGVELLAALKAADPDLAVVMMTGYASVPSAVECMKMGAADYIAKPFTSEEIRDLVERMSAERTAPQAAAALAESLHGPFTKTVIFGASRAMRQVHRLIDKVSGQPSNVVITGESGTGKELVARLIHERSPRAQRPFVVVNCAAIPETLLESELFGHKKGAFTGADYDRQGSFQTAHGGTLFLDEIGEMPQPMQAKILRAIDLGEVKQVGSDQAVRTDARVIAATNRDLKARVEADEFRRDLFYRLNVIHIALPPLRSRRPDIAVLAQNFLQAFVDQMGKPAKRFSAQALDAMTNYAWPGNVRELENAVERAVMMADGDAIEARDLPKEVANAAQTPATPAPGGANWDALAVEGRLPTLEEVDIAYLRDVLRRCNGNRTQAAKILGITPVTIWRKLGGAKGAKG